MPSSRWPRYDSRVSGRAGFGAVGDYGGWFLLSHPSPYYPTAADLQPDWMSLLGVKSLDELLAPDATRRIPREILVAYVGGLVLLIPGALLLVGLRPTTS